MKKKNQPHSKDEDIEADGHMTSIITSKNAKKDKLSKEVDKMRKQIMSKLDLGEMDRLVELLKKFDGLLQENCKRIHHEFAEKGCSDIIVDPAFGYFIPDVHEENAILNGVEPSAIVTAKDLSEEGLHAFLHAAGSVGEKYFQEAEILKFPMTKEKFEHYVENSNCPIGAVSHDHFIPTFEGIVDIPELLNETLSEGIINSENYLENIELYVNIIMNLAKAHYAASTWPTRQQGFSTIYIGGWDGAGREFKKWYTQFREILRRYRERYQEKEEEDDRRLQMGNRVGREEPSEGRGDRPQGYRMVGELLLVPQIRPGVLEGNHLLYEDLLSDEKRSILVKKLVEIL